MIQLAGKDCCGCTACSQVCNKSAISMVPDAKGFLTPVIDHKICVDCGLCKKTCPVLDPNNERFPKHVFALKNKDIEIQKKSSSGGIFSILAEEIIKAGGVVYGAIFDENWLVRHTRIDSLDDLYKLRGSKYVQSDLGNTFRRVKGDLKNNIKVLYSGTPCQIAGLKKFLHVENENLTTIDFVCHGIPNPRIWQDYINEELEDLSKNRGTKYELADFCFRDKTIGWKNYNVKFTATNKEDKTDRVSKSTVVWKHSYMLVFLKDYIVRPSCFNCRFRCGKSGADYTIADYWCIEKFYPDFFDDNGVSMLLEYQKPVPSYLLDRTDHIETSYDEACYGNICIKESWPQNRESGMFYFLHDKGHLSLYTSYSIVKVFTSIRMSIQQFINRVISKISRLFQCLK